MFNLTKQERLVLLVLMSVVLTGSCMHYILKQCPLLSVATNLIESDRLYPQLDVNTASLEELVKVPYIGNSVAGKIVKYRQDKGPLTSLDQMKLIKGIKEKNYERFKSFLKIGNEWTVAH